MLLATGWSHPSGKRHRVELSASVLCPQCRKTFAPKRPLQLFCCPEHAKAHSRNSARTVQSQGPTNFRGVDGEGITGPCLETGCDCVRFTSPKVTCTCGHKKDEHRHDYVLLGVGQDQLTNPEGLGYQEIFSFLYSQYLAHPTDAFVGYFLGYDFTLWLKGLDGDKAWFLLTDAGRARRTLHNAHHRRPAPVRINEDLIESGGAWELQMLGDKRLSLRPLVCRCDWTLPASPLLPPTAPGRRPRQAPKCKHKRPGWMHICDVGSFWQMAFLKAIDPKEWPNDPICTEAEYATIKAGKEARAVATFDDLVGAPYNPLENELLARLMERLEKGYRTLTVKLRRSEWYGPGAAVAAWMRSNDVPARKVIEGYQIDEDAPSEQGEVLVSGGTRKVIGKVPGNVWIAARKAYYGGWFEVFMHGLVPGTASSADINSAFPWVISQLPCLLHGTWHYAVGTKAQANLTKPESRCQLVHTGPGGVRGSDPFIGAMLHRNPDEGILRPHVTGGWFWRSELDAAKRAGIVDTVETDETYTYEETCACGPP